MILRITKIVYLFIYYGLTGFKSQPVSHFEPSLTDELLDQQIEEAVNKIISAMNDDDLDYPTGGRLLTPFEAHLSKNIGPSTKTRADYVEGMLLSLNSVGEEIKAMVPDSIIESSVDGSSLSSNNILVGHLGLTVDKVTSSVYPIFIDLLKDGFMYKKDSNTFVITTKVSV